VFDVVRSTVPRIDLDDVFVQKQQIAESVMNQLRSEMTEYGEQTSRAASGRRSIPLQFGPRSGEKYCHIGQIGNHQKRWSFERQARHQKNFARDSPYLDAENFFFRSWTH
jgi:hypothetical protein